MAEFLEDPSVLTKDKLKSELTANNVPLPSGEHKKEVYVQLYLKNLTVQNQKKSPPVDTFSSDEELPAPVVSNKSRSGRVSLNMWLPARVWPWLFLIDGAISLTSVYIVSFKLRTRYLFARAFLFIYAIIFFYFIVTESYQKDRQAPYGGSGGDRSHWWRFERTAGQAWRGHWTHSWWVLSQTCSGKTCSPFQLKFYTVTILFLFHCLFTINTLTERDVLSYQIDIRN